MTEPTYKIQKRNQEIYLMRKSGMTYIEIGRKLDVSKGRARNICHETFLKIRINELESLLRSNGISFT